MKRKICEWESPFTWYRDSKHIIQTHYQGQPNWICTNRIWNVLNNFICGSVSSFRRLTSKIVLPLRELLNFGVLLIAFAWLSLNSSMLRALTGAFLMPKNPSTDNTEDNTKAIQNYLLCFWNKFVFLKLQYALVNDLKQIKIVEDKPLNSHCQIASY